MYFDVLSFWYAFPWKLVAPCSRVLWRDHINPRILEVLWGKTPIGEIKHGIIIILWFCKNWRTLGRALAFSPRVLCGMKFQITNSSVLKLVWMNSMLVLMNCCKKESVRFLKEILSKFGKTTVFVLVID